MRYFLFLLLSCTKPQDVIKVDVVMRGQEITTTFSRPVYAPIEIGYAVKLTNGYNSYALFSIQRDSINAPVVINTQLTGQCYIEYIICPRYKFSYRTR